MPFLARRNTGSYAEYLVCEDANVFPLHPRLSFAQGAALGTPYFTAYKALIMGAQVIHYSSAIYQSCTVDDYYCRCCVLLMQYA